MDKNRKKRVGTMSVVILSAFAVAAIGFTGARYYSELKGTGSVGIAKFEVSTNLEGDTTDTAKFSLEDKDGTKTAKYLFSVTSNSEVALSYDVILTMPESIPDGLTFTIVDANGKDVSQSISNDRKIFTFHDVGEFTANGGTNNHTLEIESDFRHNSIMLEGVRVEVVAEQTN